MSRRPRLWVVVVLAAFALPAAAHAQAVEHAGIRRLTATLVTEIRTDGGTRTLRARVTLKL